MSLNHQFHIWHLIAACAIGAVLSISFNGWLVLLIWLRGML